MPPYDTPHLEVVEAMKDAILDRAGAAVDPLAEEIKAQAEQIDRLHGPIGLDLGAKSPAEIAVAILAEIIAVRYGVPLAQKKPGSAFPEAHDIATTDDGAAVCGTATAHG